MSSSLSINFDRVSWIDLTTSYRPTKLRMFFKPSALLTPKILYTARFLQLFKECLWLADSSTASDPYSKMDWETIGILLAFIPPQTVRPHPQSQITVSAVPWWHTQCTVCMCVNGLHVNQSRTRSAVVPRSSPAGARFYFALHRCAAFVRRRSTSTAVTGGVCVA